MVVAVLGGISSSSTNLKEEYRIILPTLNGHGEEYQLDYVSTEDSALEILDYIRANCDGENCLQSVVSHFGGQNCYGAFCQ